MERQQPEVSEAQNVRIWERPKSTKRPEKKPQKQRLGDSQASLESEKEAGVILLAPALHQTGS